MFGYESMKKDKMKLQKLFFVGILWAVFNGNLEAKRAEIVPLQDLMSQNNAIKYVKCDDKISFFFEPFPLVAHPPLYQPNEGIINTTFVLTIPHGSVYSLPRGIDGIIVTDDCIVEEMMWPSRQAFFGRHKRFKAQTMRTDPLMVAGRLAVLTQECAGCYGHWLVEVLGRLALLERYGITYDTLYVPQDYAFQRDSLALWGIESEKIVNSSGVDVVQAEDLVVPSLVCRKYPALGRAPLCCMYALPWIVEYLRNKFLPLLGQQSSDNAYSKKIFISRQDSGMRRVTNEDEVFALFEPLGFVRYYATQLSFLEQIRLFSQAEIVVSPNGSGLTNAIFCDPGTLVIELFQARGDCTFFYLSQLCGLKHVCVQTVEFDQHGGFFDTQMPLSIIQNVVDNLLSGEVLC